ncbi:hypothetical protein IG631_08010 [Alternaria alternata]|nr:hypothetical protein IG631_08010 [Alternaria alternata]
MPTEADALKYCTIYAVTTMQLDIMQLGVSWCLERPTTPPAASDCYGPVLDSTIDYTSTQGIVNLVFACERWFAGTTSAVGLILASARTSRRIDFAATTTSSTQHKIVRRRPVLYSAKTIYMRQRLIDCQTF